MRLALIGYGRMGKVLESLAIARGHEIVAIVDPAVRRAGQGRAPDCLTASAVGRADVCLEFTRPEAAVDNLLALCRLGKRVVVGTTGWYERLNEVVAVVEERKGAVICGANFSIGVNLFFRLVERAADLFGSLPDRDFCIAEAHHRGKLDAPSGTACRLAEILLARCRHKTSQAPRCLDEAIGADQIQTVSIRAGWIAGTHRVGIESPHDSIVLEHQAHSREGFADGALQAAEWLGGAPPGFYRFEDVLDDILARE